MANASNSGSSLRRGKKRCLSNISMLELLDALSDEEEFLSDSDEAASDSEDSSDADLGESDDFDISGPTGQANTGSDDNFTWKNTNTFSPYIYTFTGDSGIQHSFLVDDGDDESKYFLAYFDNDLMDIIVRETNNYFALCGACYGENWNVKRWVDVTKDELYSFFALTMLMPHVKKRSISEYWSKNVFIATEIFGKYMSRDRFVLILRFLHFANNSEPNPEDRLWKIREVFTILKNKFSDFFYPFQKLVIDESLVLFKGRLMFKQYIPSKRHRFGIKLFVLCDCETGIVLDIIIYTGTGIDVPQNDQTGASGAVVKKILEKYEGKGHLLYTDNWYTSPLLSTYLHDKNIGSCGTVRKNRKFYPKSTTKLQRGKHECQESGNLLAINWFDRRDVYLLTTFHKGYMQRSNKIDRTTNEAVLKPDVVLDYTKNMRLVDKSDMQITTIDCIRKSVKWYKKIFFHMIDVVMLNAFNMYMVKTGNIHVTLKDFSRSVITQLLHKYGTLTNIRSGRATMCNIDRLAAVNFSDRHYAQHIPAVGTRKKGQRQCHVCANRKTGDRKRSTVTTWCPECKVGLCLGECFRIYHTKKSF